MRDVLLESAYRRLIELENLLLPVIPDTVWPAEVGMVYSQIENAGYRPSVRLKHRAPR